MSAGYMLSIVPFSSLTTCGDKISIANELSGRPSFKVKCSTSFPTSNQNLIEKIRGTITNGNVEISPSAYDTAWVAMVPSRKYSGNKQPCFPQCLDWIMENQNLDGSWGLDPGHPSLVQDSLSGTLACLLALHQWNVGHQLVQRGLDFIASNGWAAGDKDQISPIGFNIIFPGMVNYAKELDLTLPLSHSLVDSLLQLRDSEIRRNGNLEYLAEGLGNSCSWKEIIQTHQRSNGSLFNSPATTAAALIHSHDDKCYEYLTSVLKACNRWVPTSYPMDIYTRLCMVDALERLGVSQYFVSELHCILDEIYRCWQEKQEEIFSDITCRAMAFRLLRTNGYDVSSDELAEFDQEHFFNTVSIQNKGVSTVLELYRASRVSIYEEEGTLEKIFAWTSSYLKQQLLNQSILDKKLQKQVEYDLKTTYGTLDRVTHKRSIELYDARDFRMMKTAYRSPAIHNQDYVLLSVQDIRISQAEYQRELQQLERWYSECRLDQLTEGRNVLQLTFGFTCAFFFEPKLSLARISYVQAVTIVTVLDDFFDLYGTKEEALSIIELVNNWKPVTTYCSEEVEIIFTALYNTLNEVAAKAYAEQGHCVKNHLIGMWHEMLTGSYKTKSSWTENDVSTLDDYLSFASQSIAVRVCALMAFPFMGKKLPSDVFTLEECTSLTQHTSLVCRLLNDIKTFKKEREERTLNSVNILTVEEAISEEAAIMKLQEMIEYHRRRIAQMVYNRKGSHIPRESKEVFLKTCKIGYCLYQHDGGDEFSSPKLIAKDINAVIWESPQLPPLSK